MSKALRFGGFSICSLLLLAAAARADFGTPSINLSNSPTTDSLFPKIARFENTLSMAVVWMESDGVTDNLWFSSSTDGGTTWTPPFSLNASGQIRDPREGYNDLINDYTFAVFADNPYIHIVMQWRSSDAEDFEIFYLQTPDLGATWHGWTPLTTNSTDSHFPDIAARAGYVHLAYTDSWPGNEELMYKRITSNGEGDVDQTRRLTSSNGLTCYPRIGVSLSGMTVNIVYEDNVSGQYQIYLKHLTNYGSGSFSTLQLTSGSFWNGLPDIVASTTTPTGPANEDQYFYIVYNTLWPGNRDIMYKRLSNWANPGYSIYTARLTYSATESRSNSITFDNTYDNIHISYHDNWPGNHDVMYRKLPSLGGGGFSGQRVSWGTGDSSHSTIAPAGGSYAYVVWSDNTSGNYEIYLKLGY